MLRGREALAFFLLCICVSAANDMHKKAGPKGPAKDHADFISELVPQTDPSRIRMRLIG